jgi:hypothetical protein
MRLALGRGAFAKIVSYATICQIEGKTNCESDISNKKVPNWDFFI